MLFLVFVELFAVAVEHVNVYVARDAADAAAIRELPMQQMHKGLELAVTGYPHIVFFQFFRGGGHVLVHKVLAHIKHGLHAATTLYGAEPNEHFLKEFLHAAHFLDFAFRRFYIEHRR